GRVPPAAGEVGAVPPGRVPPAAGPLAGVPAAALPGGPAVLRAVPRLLLRRSLAVQALPPCPVPDGDVEGSPVETQRSLARARGMPWLAAVRVSAVAAA